MGARTVLSVLAMGLFLTGTLAAFSPAGDPGRTARLGGTATQDATGTGTPGPTQTGTDLKECGVSPNPGSRHASIVKEGPVSHMVWEQVLEPGRMSEICYANNAGTGPGGDFGLGNAVAPARRVSFTGRASVWPEIARDPVSGILYVGWVELAPMAAGPADHPAYDVNTVRLVASDDAFETSSSYSIALLELWAYLGDVLTFYQDRVGNEAYLRGMEVEDSMFSVSTHRILLKNVALDFDADGIPDSFEVLGRLGYKTAWNRADTDGDIIWDLWEIEHGLDPTFDQTPVCRQLQLCDIIQAGVLLFLDLDGDGLSIGAEGLGYPVTTEVAAFPHGATATYRFWPKETGAYNLVLRTQQRTFSAVGECLSVSLAASVNAVSIGVQTDPWSDSPSDWTLAIPGSATLTADTAADVRIDLAFDPPDCGDSKVAIIRALAVDWLKLEFVGDRSEVNYKDADNTASKALVSVTTEEMVITLDPEQRDLLFELDSMVNHAFDAHVLNEVINAYSDANIVANFKVDETGLPDGGTISTISWDWPPTSTDESSGYLLLHKNPSLSAYVHVMNVKYVAGVGGIAEQSAPGDVAGLGGVLLADQSQIDDADDAVELFEGRLALFLHETGHALGSHHETSDASAEFDPVIDASGEICNDYNVMGWTYCAITDKAFHGTGNTDRRYGATSFIGRPRFSIESVRLFNFNALLSSDVGNNMAGMLFV